MFVLITKNRTVLEFILLEFSRFYTVQLSRFVLLSLSFLTEATWLSYHIHSRLSRTFLTFFEEVFEVLFRRMCPLSQAELVYLTMSKSVCQQLFWKIFKFFLVRSGERGIWTLAPGLPTYTLSRGASSASWVFLLKFISYDIHFTSGSTHRLLYLMDFYLSTRFLRFCYRTLHDSFLTYYILKKQPSIHLHFFIIISSYV